MAGPGVCPAGYQRRQGIGRVPAGPLRGPDKGNEYICQDSSLVAWLTQSTGVPGSRPTAADIFCWCTHNYTVTQTVQICGIILTAFYAAYILLLLRMIDLHRIKNVQKK